MSLYPTLVNPLTRFIIDSLTLFISQQDQIKDAWLSEDEGMLVVQFVHGKLVCEVTMNYAEIYNTDVHVEQFRSERS